MNVEKDEVLKRYLDASGVVKAQNRLVILEYLASKFQPGKHFQKLLENMLRYGKSEFIIFMI